MATNDAIARIHANALKVLKETGGQIAARLGIEPPQLDFSYKQADYQQAQELAALAAFNTRLLATLDAQAAQGDDQAQEPDGQTTDERSDDAQLSGKTTAKRRSDRSAVSER